MSRHKYVASPLGSNLEFAEYDDGDGPRVNLIEVQNPTATDFLIPSGWIVGANLLQVRTFNHTEYVAAGETVLAEVSCVEKGRWAPGLNEIDGGRAPLSVIGAGWARNSVSGRWEIDSKSRQSEVWKQVSRQEQRGGVRPTSSLQQIMSEDLKDFEIPKLVDSEIRTKLQPHRDQNGFLIGLDGEPLVMELFSEPEAFASTVARTVAGISFDLSHRNYLPVSDRDIRRFIQDAELELLLGRAKRGEVCRSSGGLSGIDTQATLDADGFIMHAITINRRHRILQAV
jgi:hypothetical protein